MWRALGGWGLAHSLVKAEGLRVVVVVEHYQELRPALWENPRADEFERSCLSVSPHPPS